jgi:NAD(P)-dependent dehydrogenase (short-subunit alcohol dehydrogenase family)
MAFKGGNMKKFTGKIAVITGAASGIGLGIARRCMKEGMKVVLADVEEKALTNAEAEMKAAGANVLAVLTDVSKAQDVEALAGRTLDTYGAVHLLFNNAGVTTGAAVWEYTLADWEWVIGVNLWGVIHGLRTFVPIMLEQNTESHIVNTASIGGLITYPASGAYEVTKHGIVALSETLSYELADYSDKIKVSVLCPAAVNTRIIDAERNRMITSRTEPKKELTPEVQMRRKALRQTLESGMSPNEVANHVFQAIKEEKFYILTHPKWNALVQMRMENILQGRIPTDPFAEGIPE